MINIREMTLDDLPQVMEIENASFSVPWSEVGFFTYLIRDDAIFLVAEEEGCVLGYMGLILCPPDGDVTNVAVAESARNKGIGKLLVSGMIKRAKEKGVNEIFLEVRVSNDPAKHLYESFGFKEIGLRKNYYEQPTEDAIVMQRKEEMDK